MEKIILDHSFCRWDEDDYNFIQVVSTGRKLIFVACPLKRLDLKMHPKLIEYKVEKHSLHTVCPHLGINICIPLSSL